MSLDVVDLRAFYASPLGRVARRFLGRIVTARWPDCVGQSVMGLGYTTPYLGACRDGAVRVLALMPGQQGVVVWPKQGPNAAALVEPTSLPLPDACVDRLLMAHALEIADDPEELLAEAWRVLSPGGRMIVIAPNRRGLWARRDTTPFGQGRPYSRSQMRDLMRKTLFSPIYTAEALYVPPFERSLLLQAAGAFERVGAALSLPGAGVHIVEATKQLYRPLAVRARARRAPVLAPALAPSPGA
ncbi:MAG: methyltransferase domain-containing protein [Methylobacteriaceae bacterium]|nr:methyltransferase domain-containing protein [Methylobacteriaceae bacterium]